MGNSINEIRLLNADEIECRIAVINERGLSLLLYKDARVDQRILDETFGMFGWKRSHQCIDGNLYCTVEILDRETGEWIAKQDVGTTGYAEKEKSQASDSFKRACFNWGIGRELYSAPFIWIPASKVQIQKKDNKFYCSESFHVLSITYSESREIAGLRLASDKGGTIFEWVVKERKPDSKKTASGEKSQNEPAKKGTVKKKSLSNTQIKGLETELQRTGVAMEAVQQRYHVDDPMQMSEETYNKVMNALSRTKSADVA
ncbi:MAG: hypothetical protein K2P40_08050 [Lachnospiraceae bacterium]|nr:hypothetical protein [Lachnospiraceae bacterium]